MPNKKETNLLLQQAKQKITVTDDYINQQIESRTSNLNYRQTKTIKAAAFLPETIIDLFKRDCSEITCKRNAEIYNLTFLPPPAEQEAIKETETAKIKESLLKLQEQEIQKILAELTSEFVQAEQERLNKELQAKIDAAKAELTKQLLEK